MPSFETVNDGDKRLYFVAMVGLGGSENSSSFFKP
jgi:hypothetical protein